MPDTKELYRIAFTADEIKFLHALFAQYVAFKQGDVTQFFDAANGRDAIFSRMSFDEKQALVTKMNNGYECADCDNLECPIHHPKRDRDDGSH